MDFSQGTGKVAICVELLKIYLVFLSVSLAKGCSKQVLPNLPQHRILRPPTCKSKLFDGLSQG
jgi:hypothetical protein